MECQSRVSHWTGIVKVEGSRHHPHPHFRAFCAFRCIVLFKRRNYFLMLRTEMGACFADTADLMRLKRPLFHPTVLDY